jgi:hypothetical protein
MVEAVFAFPDSFLIFRKIFVNHGIFKTENFII